MTSTLPSLTPEGRNRITAALSQYQSGNNLYEDLLADILGAELNFGKSHTYLFPRTLRGVDLVTGGQADKFVLKICHSHLNRRPHDCYLQREVWVWKEAVRRGDENLFAPIAESDLHCGWSVMSYGYPLGELDYASAIPQSSNEISLNELSEKLIQQLEISGWIPYDTETKAINGEPVIIDYEKVYREDMFDELYIHSFSSFYEHELYDSEILEAIHRDLYQNMESKGWKPTIYDD